MMGCELILILMMGCELIFIQMVCFESILIQMMGCELILIQKIKFLEEKNLIIKKLAILCSDKRQINPLAKVNELRLQITCI